MSGIADVQARIASIQQQFNTGMAQVGVAGRMTSIVGSPAANGGLSFDQVLASAQQTLSGATASTPVAGTPVGVTGQDVVADASRYLGVPYVWGGTNPKVGLDCSGFTQLAYKDLGVTLPRTADAQARQGVAVPSLAQARPGDLVAFDNAAGGGMDHIGIYIGNGKMIVSPRSGENVKIQNVGKPDAIRRIIAQPATSLAPTAFVAAATGGETGVARFDALFANAGARYGVPAGLLKAVAQVESNGNPSARSGVGALGLMQLMPETAQGLGVDPLNPGQAVDGAAKMLGGLIRKFGTVDLALAGYNAGEGAVSKYGGIPPFKETQEYVPKVKALWATYR
ncbi:NlpC/P60 family protein [Tessaracoccus sp.]